jgi:putative flavoprotein involved in K+ transport
VLKTTTVVVGAGHCGLAMSRCLAEKSIDHVVLERGEVANSWHTQRWDSLRLLTPNWMTRLPGYAYRGEDPDGYLSAAETAQLITDYAKETAAPVRANTTVMSVRPVARGYVVQTDQDTWHARTVVAASGGSAVARVPALRHAVPDSVTTLTPTAYRNPSELPDGGVLVVGASASGIQIAEELHRSGRPVTIAVGEHVRMPRTYRGRDILWWMDASGLLDERYDEIPDLARARRLPSMQLVGTSERKTLDLNALRGMGVQLVGRLAGIRDGLAQFSGSLANVFSLADLKLGRLLDTIDTWAAKAGPSLRRNPDDHMGHRSTAGSVVARCPDIRPQGPRGSRRRRDRQPRPLSDRPAVSAAPEVDAHRRRSSRRRRPHRPPRAPPRCRLRRIRWTTTTT